MDGLLILSGVCLIVFILYKIGKKPYKPYVYKSDNEYFNKLHQEILSDFENDSDLSIIVAKIGELVAYMETVGDKKIVEQLQAKIRVKLAIKKEIRGAK